MLAPQTTENYLRIILEDHVDRDTLEAVMCELGWHWVNIIPGGVGTPLQLIFALPEDGRPITYLDDPRFQTRYCSLAAPSDDPIRQRLCEALPVRSNEQLLGDVPDATNPHRLFCTLYRLALLRDPGMVDRSWECFQHALKTPHAPWRLGAVTAATPSEDPRLRDWVSAAQHSDPDSDVRQRCTEVLAIWALEPPS